MHVSRRHRPFSGGPRFNVSLGEGGYGGHRQSRFKGAGYDIAKDAEALGAARHPSVWKLTPRQMSAFLFIQEKRRKREAIEFVGQVRLAMNGEKKDIEKQYQRWARDAEVRLLMD